ncbi:hypothetical protein G6F57_005599 [Rhizopus arrhizus]|uniref:Ribosomal protein L10 n=1 Tax=Rhizopus oryzae TaxID=64495 RepID=A0A9P6XBI7_RHIOR|nr:hypothetical protein G6F23_005621 [Rhizopus arrhizus]KAG0767419.1 hypothetical protein G6F24_002804 [Rhizopus arrhizus]KAG0789935.1 hypothetical protein G6F22_006558 [Rhizopus arrhizus]KAG0791297.1 hypothetical protein G6F21_005186 [Rhizopus arrhizus]KAG0811861.1 hypothetical protein G6F20_006822 [Rhizopus arrhizus]
MSLRSFSQSLIRNLKPINTPVRTYATTQKKGPVHPPRRTYLYNQYNDIIQNNRAVFIFQHNNLTVKEFTQLRQDLKSEATLTVLRPSVFAAALRTTKYLNLEPLLSGPTCVLYSNADDSTDLLKTSVELLSKNRKLLLLGGKLDDHLLTQSDVLKVVDLPSLDQLRAQMVGVIEAPARKLISTLSQPANELHSVLDRRI